MTMNLGGCVRMAMMAAALAVAAAAGEARAQVAVSLEARGDIAAPVGDFADGADIGVAYGASVTVGVGRGVGVYAGYSGARFGLRDSRADATDQGFEAGVRTVLPGAYAPWLAAGVVLHELEVEDGGAPAEGDADPGFEVEAGVALPIGDARG